ncbi:MAG: phosphoribosylanthranilate isomerase [Pirellulales bacterium]
MFRIKICGVTSVEDAQMVAAAGADAIGLNFYPPSPRYLDTETATAIAASIPGDIARVGVFVDAQRGDMRRLAHLLRLTHLQWHGDEIAERVPEYSGYKIVKAFRLGSNGTDSVIAWLDQAWDLQALPERYLIDAYQPGAPGGTGQTADWSQVAELARIRHRSRLILAGGLTPDNVAEAILKVRPGGVDTASGVESAPGKKDPARVRDFVAAAQAAFAQLDAE